MTVHGGVAARPSVRLPLTLAAGVLADVAFDPLHRHVPLCPFRAITGWDCPLCGGLRAVDELAHAHLGEALQANLLLVVTAPIVIGLCWASMSRRAAGRYPLRWPRWSAVGIAAVLVLFTVVRNVPSMAALRPS